MGMKFHGHEKTMKPCGQVTIFTTNRLFFIRSKDYTHEPVYLHFQNDEFVGMTGMEKACIFSEALADKIMLTNAHLNLEKISCENILDEYRQTKEYYS